MVIEYCLVASLVGLLVMAGAGGYDGALSSPFDRIVVALTNATGGQNAVNSTSYEDELSE